MTGFFLDMVYPRRCPVCHDIAAPAGRTICRDCADKLKPLTAPRCMRCSKPVTRPEAELCYDCSSKTHQFTQGIGIFPYSSILSKSLYQIKYHQRKEYAVFYGRYAAAYAERQIRKWQIQALVPVPLHPRKRESRGYNQAEVIAAALGAELGIPLETDTVIRKINTKPQKELTDRERYQNMKLAFATGKRISCRERILIVDDIYTTGSTIDGVAKILKEEGVKEIYFLTIAIGTGF